MLWSWSPRRNTPCSRKQEFWATTRLSFSKRIPSKTTKRSSLLSLPRWKEMAPLVPGKVTSLLSSDVSRMVSASCRSNLTGNSSLFLLALVSQRFATSALRRKVAASIFVSAKSSPLLNSASILSNLRRLRKSLKSLRSPRLIWSRALSKSRIKPKRSLMIARSCSRKASTNPRGLSSWQMRTTPRSSPRSRTLKTTRRTNLLPRAKLSLTSLWILKCCLKPALWHRKKLTRLLKSWPSSKPTCWNRSRRWGPARTLSKKPLQLTSQLRLNFRSRFSLRRLAW